MATAMVDCPYCKRPGAKQMVNRRGYRVVKCNECGGWGTLGKATDEEKAQYEAEKQAREEKSGNKPAARSRGRAAGNSAQRRKQRRAEKREPVREPERNIPAPKPYEPERKPKSFWDRIRDAW